jgi:hypothetical protein
MEPEPKDLPRMRVLFALRKFPSAVQSDVLADGMIAARFDVPVSQPAQLSDELTIQRPLLFSAFQKAADGEPLPPFTDEDGKPLDVKITLEGHAAVIAYQEKRWRFPYAAFCSSQPSRRLAILDQSLSQHSLAIAHCTRVKTLLARQDYSDRDFMTAISLLSGSPESFAANLREKASAGRFSMSDVLSRPPEYWDNLTAALAGSTTLADFIAHELADERRARIAQDPARALVMISLTFGSPTLVPRDLLTDVPDESLLDGLNRLSKVDDPLGLCGAFDACVDRVADNPRFIDAGEKLLKKVFGDTKRLETAFDVYAAIFVITTAYFSEHETLRHKPVYWRRLAAASHAALVLRTLGAGNLEKEALLTWGFRVKGQPYFLSTFNDFRAEPRWRPDWIVPRYLIADAYGRAFISCRRFTAGDLPPGWQEPIAVARTWIEDNNFQLMAYVPALLEGARHATIPTIDELNQLAGADVVRLFKEFVARPTIDVFIKLTPVIWSLGCPLDAVGAVSSVMSSLRGEAANADQEVVGAALSLAADIAAQNLDKALGDLVAEISIERSVNGEPPKSFAPVVFILLACSAAHKDAEEARMLLARRLETLAFLLPPSRLGNLLGLLLSLQSLDEPVAERLGRAVATARLGLPRMAA